MQSPTVHDAINKTITDSSNDFYRLCLEEWPGWYPKAVAEIATIANAEDLRFADVGLEVTERGHTARIVVFTDHLLIVIAAEQSEEDHGSTHTTSVRARSSLTSFKVEASVGASFQPQTDAPGLVTVVLDYGDDEEIRLPAGTASPEQHRAVEVLLPSLRRDLVTH